MTEPKIAQKGPFEVAVKAGRTYFWCACGRSARQPFCDGSHKDTGFEPVSWKAEAADTLYFCGCKRTGSKPFCDGTHETL
ncbi:CDGSH iron-sulfur domain-containing protein [Oceanibacterium hippocampi]|uniref:Iron-binding zinc finger CDGSH type n=1 Tax=Oceanibacterium hippocampi TaxID=745714 RepID=A0A1Y5SAJ6_9PROT|nr:CDGSH iron-sulfur domain-containing protein [Oceanibacterium hippocampi]SLN33700.1 Iron-binding zinc finger CDGSH type [Oceanibacterium hippocampi]